MAYHTYHGVDTRIIRIFNTYGPRMRPRDGRVVSNFIVQALSGEPLTIYGDGSQTRSFCYVSDEVEGIYQLFMKGDHQPDEHRQPRRVHGEAACRARRRAHGHHRTDRVRAAAGGRSEGAQAGHHARPHDARLGADGPRAGRARAHDRVLPAARRHPDDGCPGTATPSRRGIRALNSTGDANRRPRVGRRGRSGVSFPGSSRTVGPLAGIVFRYASNSPGAARRAASRSGGLSPRLSDHAVPDQRDALSGRDEGIRRRTVGQRR